MAVALTTLMQACAVGDHRVITSIISSGIEGVDINHVHNENNATALHVAAEKGNLDVAKYLVNVLKADVNQRKPRGISAHRNDEATAIMFACRQGDWDMFKFLLDAGSDVTLRKADGSDCLFLAAQAGSLRIVRHLIEVCGMRADERRQIGDFQSIPLFQAVLDGHLDVVEYLTRLPGCDPYADGGRGTVMHLACFTGSIEMVKLLFAWCPGLLNAELAGYLPLHIALKYDHYALVDWFLSECSAPFPEVNALDVALKYGSIHSAQVLSAYRKFPQPPEEGASFSPPVERWLHFVQKWCFLQYAVSARLEKRVRQLLHDGTGDAAMVNKNTFAPVLIAKFRNPLAPKFAVDNRLAALLEKAQHWTPSGHALFCPRFREGIIFMHVVYNRLCREERLPRLPIEMWHHILFFLSRTDFNLP